MLVKRRKRPRKADRILVEVSPMYNPLVVEVGFMENLSAKDMRVATRRPWELGSYIYVKSTGGDVKTRAKVVSCTARDSGNYVIDLDILRLVDEQK